MGDVPFKCSFPRLFRLSRYQNSTVESLAVPITIPIHRDFGIRRTVNDEDILEFSSLLIELKTLNLVDSKPDGRKWKLKSAGNFSCKSFHSYLISDNSDRVFVPAKFLWKAKAHPKVKVLGWIGEHGRVNTCDVLQKRRPHSCFSPHWCVLCKAQGGKRSSCFCTL